MSTHSMDDYDLEQNKIYIREKRKEPARPINPGLGFIIAAIVLAVILWNFISNWENQTTLTRYFLAFYDYTIIEPIRFIPRFFEYAKDANFTPYNNLNIVLVYSLIGAYIFIFIPYVLKLIGILLEKINLKKYKWLIFFTPAILYVLSNFVIWLFK